MPQTITKKVRESGKSSSGSRKSPGLAPAFALLFSVAAGTAALLLSAALFAFLLGKTGDPDKWLSVSAAASAVLAGAASGGAAARLTGRPMPWSAAAGALMALVYLLVSLCFDPAEVDNGTVYKTLILVLTILSAYAVGAIAGGKGGRGRKRPAGSKSRVRGHLR